MKYFFFALGLLFTFSQQSFGQMWNGQDSLYGNEWIDADAEYYKFSISEDGIYRIDHATLVASGFPISNHQGLSLRIFAFGEEIPIHVTTNGFFGSSDYIEFYGEKNRSQLDQHLFENPEEDQLNPDYSLITDKATHFLTWEGPGTPVRYETVDNNLNGVGSPLNFFLHTSSLNFNSKEYSFKDNNNVKYSNFDSGEGFAGLTARNHELKIPTPFRASAGPASEIELRMSSNLFVHDLVVNFNGSVLHTSQFGGIRLIKVNEPLDNQTLVDENTLNIDGNFDGNDQYAVALAKITYPRNFNFDGADFFKFPLSGNGQQYLEISNFGSNGNPYLYDITNGIRIETSITGDIVRVNLPAGQGNRQVVLNDNGAIRFVADLSKVNMPDLTASDASYIIISHPLLNNANGGSNPVQDYADFRSSASGGNYNVQIINVTDLQDVFGYGIERHPIAIRNFTNYIHKNWTNPELIFLLGKGRDYTETRTEAELNSPLNSSFYIPTLGTPGSDNLMLAAPNSNIPLIPVGRLAASTKEQITIYLNKMKDMAASQNGQQTIEDRAWMKNIMHLSGGGVNEQQTISTHLKKKDILELMLPPFIRPAQTQFKYLNLRPFLI